MINYEEFNLKFRYFRFVELNDYNNVQCKHYHIIIVQDAVYELKERHPKYPYIKESKPIRYMTFETQKKFIGFKKTLSDKWKQFIKYSKQIDSMHCMREIIHKRYDYNPVEVLTEEEFREQKTINYYYIRKDQTLRKYKTINTIIKFKSKRMV